jgi:hypothetical protein
MAWEHPEDVKVRRERLAAEAIWKVSGSPPRLLDEITRPNTDLARQQMTCWKQARAAVAALFDAGV